LTHLTIQKKVKGFFRHKKTLGWAAVLTMLMLAGCYSNNCPLENTVTCNYGFYDAAGTPITYVDTITVTTLKPGYKTVYIYRKLGNVTVTKDYPDSTLTAQGYSETAVRQRKDTILRNKQYDISTLKVPMSFYHNADTLVFAYGRISLRDTLVIQHDSYPYVELPECGTYRFHTLKSITATDAAIDHVEIIQPKVNYDGETNVKIYFNGVVE